MLEAHSRMAGCRPDFIVSDKWRSMDLSLPSIRPMDEKANNIMVGEDFNQQLSVITQSSKSVGWVYSEGDDS